MTINAEDAALQAKSLSQAAESSPVRQYRYELRRRAKEWQRAAESVPDLGDGVIELAGSLAPGMQVLHEHDLGNWAPLIRTMQQGGQFTLHLEDPTGRPVYQNLCGPVSPVVVKS